MINRVILVGRLTKDPEFKMTPSGVAVARFILAVNRTHTNNQGQREADYVSIVVWRRQAEIANQYLHKGSLVGIDGKIQTGSYEGQDGKRVYTTDVVAESVQFLETQKQEKTMSEFQNSYKQQPNNFVKHQEDPFANMGGKIDITEDDLPF